MFGTSGWQETPWEKAALQLLSPLPLLLANKASFPLTGVCGGGVRIVGPPSADHLEMQLPRN